ncbi:hypothetical protein AHAS_Ahas11G0070000 [Arachis hypogaea]
MYVDDLVLAGSDWAEIVKLLDDRFRIRVYLNSKFLGLEMARSQQGTPLDDVTPYWRLIGRLIYLANTNKCHDICFTVNKLSQFLGYATAKHFQAALLVLRYLKVKGAPAKGVLFSTSDEFTLTTVSDLY